MKEELIYTKLIREKTTYLYHTIGIDNCLIKTNFPSILPIAFHEKQYEMMCDTLSFAYLEKKTSISLDNYVSALLLQDAITHGDKEDDIIKSISNLSFLRTPIELQEFNEIRSLIIQEYFGMEVNYFIDPSWNFIEGYYYFNEPTITLIGVKFKEVLWGLLWQPYS